MYVMPSIKIADLRQALTLIFDELESFGITEIELDEDYYWTLLGPEIYALEKSPEPSLGQLYDDLTELNKLVSGLQEPVPTFHLDVLAALLTFIGNSYTK